MPRDSFRYQNGYISIVVALTDSNICLSTLGKWSLMEKYSKELVEKLHKVDRNYKNYRNEWVFTVTEKQGVYIISAKNKNRAIGLRGGGEFYKRLYLSPSNKMPGTFLAHYQYGKSDRILLLFFLLFTRVICPATVLWGIYVTIFSGKIPILGGLLMIALSFVCTISGYNWAKGRGKLEVERYNIISEVLTKNNIEFTLVNGSKSCKK